MTLSLTNIESTEPMLVIKGARNPVSLDFIDVGGLDTEFKEIFKRVFASRLYPPQTLKDLGINHVRGMLLYGPPGCGQMHIARQISKMQLNGPVPKIVNGPEIMTEKNIRKLFVDAEVPSLRLMLDP